MRLTRTFPCLPLIESLNREAWVLSEEKEWVANNLHQRSCAASDFPESQQSNRIDRVQQHMTSCYGNDFIDPNNEGSIAIITSTIGFVLFNLLRKDNSNACFFQYTSNRMAILFKYMFIRNTIYFG